MISYNSIVAEKLNNYFIDVIENQEIEYYNENLNNENKGRNNERKEIETIITKYENHPSILKIKEHIKVTEKFTFSKPMCNDLDEHIKSPDPKNLQWKTIYPLKLLLIQRKLQMDI